MKQQTELDFIIDSLDEMCLDCKAGADLAKLLVENLGPLSDIDRIVVLLSDAPDKLRTVSVLEQIWESFDQQSLSEQSRRRLLISIIGPQEPLDTHSGRNLAEFAIDAGMSLKTLTRLIREFVQAKGRSGAAH